MRGKSLAEFVGRFWWVLGGCASAVIAAGRLYRAVLRDDAVLPDVTGRVSP